jgi:hypothetical protein
VPHVAGLRDGGGEFTPAGKPGFTFKKSPSTGQKSPLNIQEIGIYVREIATYSQEIASDVQGMAANIGEIRIYWSSI